MSLIDSFQCSQLEQDMRFDKMAGESDPLGIVLETTDIRTIPNPSGRMRRINVSGGLAEIR